jgi:hypothetical protein
MSIELWLTLALLFWFGLPFTLGKRTQQPRMVENLILLPWIVVSACYLLIALGLKGISKLCWGLHLCLFYPLDWVNRKVRGYLHESHDPQG